MQVNHNVKPFPVEDDESLFLCEHKAALTLCYVTKNNLGITAYGIYLEDGQNLRKPVGLELHVYPDGSQKFYSDFDPEDLFFLKESDKSEKDRN